MYIYPYSHTCCTATIERVTNLRIKRSDFVLPWYDMEALYDCSLLVITSFFINDFKL